MSVIASLYDGGGAEGARVVPAITLMPFFLVITKVNSLARNSKERRPTRRKKTRKMMIRMPKKLFTLKTFISFLTP